VAVVDPNSYSQSLPGLHMLIGCPTQTTQWPNLRENASFFEPRDSLATVLGIRTVVFRCHGFRSHAAARVQRPSAHSKLRRARQRPQLTMLGRIAS
jgi:hypothetical protein